jgi:hypothetical protein
MFKIAMETRSNKPSLQELDLPDPPHPPFEVEDRTDQKYHRFLLEIEWARQWVANERAEGRQPN